jgi:Fe-S-cluster containining protein
MPTESESKQKRKQSKPKKIYRTVIKLSPGHDSSQPGSEPQIDIDTETLRPKLIKPSMKFKRKPPKDRLGSSTSKPDDSKIKMKVAKRFDEELIQRMEWVPVTSKTRWVCTRCGWCCSHEWRVNLTWDEYDRLKDKLSIEDFVVDDQSGMSHPFYMIKDKCVQYDTKKHKCKIYKIRAYSCATYPFSITPDGKLVRSKFCKGFGKGEKVNKKKMVDYIYKWRKRAGMQV